MPDVIYGVTWNGNNVLNYTYDSLGRLTDKTVILNESEESNLNTTYEYYDVDDTKTTTLLKSVTTLDVPYTYEYDELGNITEINIKDGELSSYEYDELNQLVRENSVAGNKTYTYQYVNGNIKYKHEYAYTTGTLPATPIKTTEYHYEDSTWSDVLTKITETTYSNTNTSTNTYSLNGLSDESTSFDALAKSILGNNYQKVDLTANALVNVENNDLGNLNMNIYSTNSEAINSTTLFEIESDEIGNMVKINDVDFNWNGRRLESISQEGTGIISYEYNIDGQRVSKTVTDPETNEVTTTEYFYNGSILAGQKTGNDTIIFMYDNNGDVFGFTYNGTPYYYVKNAQNDVWLITDENGQAVILYFYDAWGKVMGCLDGTDFGLATINPITYRSYYADLETGLYMYYLNSRYYVADWGRFISADSVISGTGESVHGYNLFAYCFNNPVNYSDANGNWPEWVEKAASWVNNNIIQPVKNFFNPNTNTISGQFQDGILKGSGSVTGGYSENNTRLQVNSKGNSSRGMLGIYEKASIGNVNGKVGVGNDNVTLSLKGVGDCLTSTAQMGIQYSEGFGVAARLKASVLTARITSELEIFGWQIELGVSGDLLSVGAEAMIGVFPDEGFTAKASVGAGLVGCGLIFRVKPAQ